MFNDNEIEFNNNFPRRCFIIGATGPTGPTGADGDTAL